MKAYTLIILICIFSFSCGRKNEGNDAVAVVFWTKNASKFSACSSSIEITVRESLNDVFVDKVNITTLSSAAPDCSGSAKVAGLFPGRQYIALTGSCAGYGGISFSVAPNECLKLELP